MFLVAQFIGLYVVSSNSLPDYLNTKINPEEQGYSYLFFQIITSFFLAIMIFVFITKYKLVTFMRIWFMFVTTIALSISIFAIIKPFFNYYLFALSIALFLGILKIVRPSILVHNGTELLIYPGIATVFVQILNPFYVLLLLLLITIYDFWAVWHSGLMQKMAKFQMNEMKIFGGFFVPYLNAKIRAQIKKIKLKKGSKLNKRLRVPVALLGGGDIVFPIITAGVFMQNFGLISGLFVIGGAFLGLTYLLLFSKGKKFYPAMVYITPGILLGLICWGLAFL